jgi:hypothetical protein
MGGAAVRSPPSLSGGKEYTESRQRQKANGRHDTRQNHQCFHLLSQRPQCRVATKQFQRLAAEKVKKLLRVTVWLEGVWNVALGYLGVFLAKTAKEAMALYKCSQPNTAYQQG